MRPGILPCIQDIYLTVAYDHYLLLLTYINTTIIPIEILNCLSIKFAHTLDSCLEINSSESLVCFLTNYFNL